MIRLIFCLLLVSFITKAQDTLIFKEGTKIVSLVLLVGEDSIRYKRIENITGADLYAKNSELSYVKYKSGAIKNMDSLYTARTRMRELAKTYTMVPEAETITPEFMREKGKQHADVNYHCKGCTAAFSGVTFVFGPVLGWLSASALGQVPPLEKKLAYPSEELWQDENYRKGYKSQAWKMKKKSMRNGAWVGTFASIFTYALIVTVYTNSNP